MSKVPSLFAAGLLLASGALTPIAQAQEVPTRLSFTARLVDNGVPVEGRRDFVFKLFPQATGGGETWTEIRTALMVANGSLNVELGAITPLNDSIFDGQALYLEVAVGGTVLSPRTPVLSVPYAMRSTVAGRVGGLAEPDIQRRVAGGCGPGSAIRSIEPDGTVSCQAAAVTVNDAGVAAGLTGVYGGAGLTGGGAIGDVTLGVNFAGTGSATSAARSDHDHDGTYLPLGPVLACSGTDKVVGIAPNGSVVCAADQGGGGGSGVASVGASPPLSSSGGANPVLSLGTVPLANGGTGETTAARARASLGAASSGANSDIISLSGLTTVLSAAQGGTGMGVPATPGHFLKSNNSGWMDGPLLPTDLPRTSPYYIQNQSGAAQAADLHVNGVIRTSGLVRSGSEMGTSEPPSVDAVSGGYGGMVVRRINSETIGLGSVVARTDMLSFQRNGTLYGFRLVKVGTDNRRQTLVCQGVSGAGLQINRVIDVPAGAAITMDYLVYSSADDIVMMNCVFGGMDASINQLGHHTTVTLARTNSGVTYFGTLTSTYNQ